MQNSTSKCVVQGNGDDLAQPHLDEVSVGQGSHDNHLTARYPGPGRIWLQTLPIAKLAHELMEYMPRPSSEAAKGGVVGGIVGSILEGMK